MHRAAALFALPALALANGVSLSEFHPTVSGLSPNCEALYTSQLPGCQPSDFESQHCSQSCLSTLATVTGVIHQVCGNENLHGTNLISAFLAGDGTQKICPNAPGNSASSSQSSAQQNTQSTSAQVASSSSAVQTSASSSPSTSSTATSATSTSASAISTSVTTPAGIAIDSTGSPTVQPTATPSSTSSSTNNANSQQNIAHGGSPFDLSGNTNAAEQHAARMISGITAALLVVLLGSLAI